MRIPRATSPDPVHVAPDVHLVAVAEDVVLLDARQDRYLCLPGAAASITLSSCRRRLGIADPVLRDELVAAGLVATVAPPSLPWRPPAAPRRSALPDTVETLRAGDLGDIAWAMALLGRHYWRRPFLDLTRDAQARANLSNPGVDEPALMAIAAAFQRWAPYAPTSAKCLLRAFVLLRLLQRHGHHARWVFGVRTWPFEAHCWLQVGDLVLDDDVERVRTLEPILVIG